MRASDGIYIIFFHQHYFPFYLLRRYRPSRFAIIFMAVYPLNIYWAAVQKQSAVFNPGLPQTHFFRMNLNKLAVLIKLYCKRIQIRRFRIPKLRIFNFKLKIGCFFRLSPLYRSVYAHLRFVAGFSVIFKLGSAFYTRTIRNNAIIPHRYASRMNQINISEYTVYKQHILIFEVACVAVCIHLNGNKVFARAYKIRNIEFRCQSRIFCKSDKASVYIKAKAIVNTLKMNICFRRLFRNREFLPIISHRIFLRNIRRVKGKRIFHVRIRRFAVSAVLPHGRHRYNIPVRIFRILAVKIRYAVVFLIPEFIFPVQQLYHVGFFFIPVKHIFFC